MNKSVIYVGEFVLPDKSAAANRVVSNGKIFEHLGYRPLFLGAAATDDQFDGIRSVANHENMYEQAHPATSRQWIHHIFSTRNVQKLAEDANPHIVIAYNLSFLTFLRLKRVFKKQGVRVAYDCTEWTGYTDGSFLKRMYKKVDEWLLRHLLAKVCDNLIVISDRMAQQYAHCKNLIQLPPLVDTSCSIWHQAVQRDEDVFEFCFSGRPDGDKESLDLLVNAFCSLEETKVRLRIVGLTKQEFLTLYPALEEQAKDPRLVFMGQVPHAQSIGYTLGCDCYVFIRQPDRRNQAGFPTKFAESYTCGGRILTTNISDVGRYFTSSRQGTLLTEISHEAIRTGLQQELYKGKRESCGQLRTTFDFTAYTQRVKEFLEP